MTHTTKLIFACGLLAAAVALAPARASAQTARTAPSDDADRKAVEQVVGYYFAMGPDDPELANFHRAFHPDAKMLFMRDGALVQVTMPEWEARMRVWAKEAVTSPAPKALSRRVAAIDVTGDAATAKAVSDFDKYVLVDYFSLLKIDGQWKIVGKIFTRRDK